MHVLYIRKIYLPTLELGSAKYNREKVLDLKYFYEFILN